MGAKLSAWVNVLFSSTGGKNKTSILSAGEGEFRLSVLPSSTLFLQRPRDQKHPK